MFRHKQMIGMKKIFVSFYTACRDEEPLLERKWFTVEKNVTQRQDKDLIPDSFFQSRASIYGNGSDIIPFSPHPCESITNHYLYITADGQSWNTFALICSLFCFISIKMYKLNFGK